MTSMDQQQDWYDYSISDVCTSDLSKVSELTELLQPNLRVKVSIIGGVSVDLKETSYLLAL